MVFGGPGPVNGIYRLFCLRRGKLPASDAGEDDGNKPQEEKSQEEPCVKEDHAVGTDHAKEYAEEDHNKGIRDKTGSNKHKGVADQVEYANDQHIPGQPEICLLKGDGEQNGAYHACLSDDAKGVIPGLRHPVGIGPKVIIQHKQDKGNEIKQNMQHQKPV